MAIGDAAIQRCTAKLYGAASSSVQGKRLNSALDMLQKTAEYVESMVNSDPTAGSIRLLITAKSVNQEGPEILILHGPNGIAPPTSGKYAFQTVSQSNIVAGPVSIAPAVATAVASSAFTAQENENHRLHEVIRAEGGNVTTPAGLMVTSAPVCRVVIPAAVNSGTRVNRESGNLVVPDDVAAECLSLLLNASGCSGRVQYSNSDDSSSSVPLRVIKKAMSELFSSASRYYKSRRQTTSGMKYATLLPMGMRKRQAVFSSLSLRKSRHGKPFIVTGTHQTTLNVKKASVNGKEMNIGFLTVVYAKRPPHMDVREIFLKLALGGYALDGCTSCIGDCVGKPRSLCEIFSDNIRTVSVGTGCVDPFETHVLGTPIPVDSFHVRFAEVKEGTPSQAFPGVDEGDVKNILERPVVWPKDNISRVTVKGEYGDVVGTAILVDRMPVRSSVGIRTARTARAGTFNLSGAVLLTDFRCAVLREEHQSENDDRLRYPFAEWYKVRELERMRTLHFHGEKVPKKTPQLTTYSAFLWHNSCIET